MKQPYLLKWWRRRGFRFLGKRLHSLLTRYGLSANKLIKQIDACMATLAEFGCRPTFFVPAVVLSRYPRFFRRLEKAGAEIAIHGNRHVDLSALPLPDAREELVHAVQVFKNHGIEPHGFRCPYLGCGRELLEALPLGLFDYSSNVAIEWDCNPLDHRATSFSRTLGCLYGKKRSQDIACLPRQEPDLIEIPVCTPDDLGLHDGFKMGSKEMAQVWCQLLHQTHVRGELFTLLFHSELVPICEQSFRELFYEVQTLQPSVWVAKLSEINDWWREKAEFKVEVIDNLNGVQLSFWASPRATILARGLGIDGSQHEWDGIYNRLGPGDIQLTPGMRPFVGLPSTAAQHIMSFLRNQGYILDNSEHNHQCAVYIDQATLSSLENEVQLVNYIETSASSLIRFGRWPDGAKSALSISGDLDALALVDYGARMINR